MFIQQANQLSRPPVRIVSLVPSITELLSDLQLEDETAGITKFCVHPTAWFEKKTRIGGTKTPDLNKIRDIRPDLILANREENTQDQVEALAEEFPVWLTQVSTYEEALSMINDIGQLTNRIQLAEKLVDDIRQAFKSISLSTTRIPAAYLIWRKPYMTVGQDTYIHDLLQKAGFRNVFEQKSRYPQITADELAASGCRCMLLSSEPYPFKEKHIQELQTMMPHCRILLVDGEIFSWYGSRLLHAPAYFREIMARIADIND